MILLLLLKPAAFSIYPRPLWPILMLSKLLPISTSQADSLGHILHFLSALLAPVLPLMLVLDHILHFRRPSMEDLDKDLLGHL
jgi:hypothetical protein